MANDRNEFDLNSERAITLHGPTPGYGVKTRQDGWATPEDYSIETELPFRFRFLVAEILGLLFVLASTAYIFVVPSRLSRWASLKYMVGRAVKRTMDIIGATVGLVIALPFMIIVAILIRIDSPGPIFYTQVRVGRNRRDSDRRYHRTGHIDEHRRRDRRREDYLGKLFRVIKFRTMVPDAEQKSGPVWAREGDPRVTKLGRFLRKSRIDEIPQFVNVLMGDMSLVGPRPERPHFVKDLCRKIDGYERRLSVKPGITGLAQVENGYDSSVESVHRKVRSDLTYIDNMSLWTDIKILARTVIVVITGRGAC